MKEYIGSLICSFSFWYDQQFLSHLTMNEDDWSTFDKFKWKIFNILYRFGTFLLR